MNCDDSNKDTNKGLHGTMGDITTGICQLRQKSQVRKKKLWDSKRLYINCAGRYLGPKKIIH